MTSAETPRLDDDRGPLAYRDAEFLDSDTRPGAAAYVVTPRNDERPAPEWSAGRCVRNRYD